MDQNGAGPADGVQQQPAGAPAGGAQPRPRTWGGLCKEACLLFTQRTLEHTVVDVATVAAVKVVRSLASEDGLARLLGTAGPHIYTLKPESLAQKLTKAVTGRSGVSVSLMVTVAGAGLYYLMTSGASSASAANGVVIEEVVGEPAREAGGGEAAVQGAAPAPPLPLPRLLVLSLELAARGCSLSLTNDLLGLWEPSPSELEAVPLSGRLRARLPPRSFLEQTQVADFSRREVWVDDLSRPEQLRFETHMVDGLKHYVGEVLPELAWGPGVTVLPPGPELVEAVRQIGAFDSRLGGAGGLLRAQHGFWAAKPVTEGMIHNLRRNRIALALVDPDRPAALGFTYTRAARGGVAASRPVPSNWHHQQRMGSAEARLLGGVNSGSAIAVNRGPYGSSPLLHAGVLAHELTHYISRHTAESETLLHQSQLAVTVRALVCLALRPLVRRATSAALGCPMAVASPATTGSAALVDRALGAAASLFLHEAVSYARGELLIRPGAPLFAAAAAGHPLALRLIHELEAEQGAMVMLASAGVDFGHYALSRVGMIEYIKAAGDGDIAAGLKALRQLPASSLTISGTDVQQWWPDIPKLAWALAQVNPQAIALLLRATAGGGEKA